jgi:copper chaperone CopZ
LQVLKRLKLLSTVWFVHFALKVIEKKLSSQLAVKNVDVNLAGHLVKGDLKDGQDLSDGVITQVLTDAGYSVSNIERH